MAKADRILTKIVFSVIGGFVAGAIFTSLFVSFRTEAQTSVKYNYFHYQAGSCRQSGGQGVIDLRNGNVWCVPTSGGEPIFDGTLNLGAIPERPPSAR